MTASTTSSELIHVKALVAEEIRDGGSVVLNADDPVVAALAGRPAVRAHAPVIRFFSMTPGNPVLSQHKNAGGVCYEIISGQLTETEGGEQRPLLAVADLPGAYGGRAGHVVANALAAVAACRAARRQRKGHLPRPRGLHALPGRTPAAATSSAPAGRRSSSTTATTRRRWRRRAGSSARSGAASAVAAITLPGDRRDDLLAASAEAIAAWFGTVVLYEDSDKRGRQAGEMLDLIGAALAAARPGIRCVPAESPAEALQTALDLAGEGPVLFLYEKLGMAHDALAAVGAQPWPEGQGGTGQDPTAGAAATRRPGAWTAPLPRRAMLPARRSRTPPRSSPAQRRRPRRRWPTPRRSWLTPR